MRAVVLRRSASGSWGSGPAGPVQPGQERTTGGWWWWWWWWPPVGPQRWDGRADFRGLSSFLLGVWRVDRQPDLPAAQLQACRGETGRGSQFFHVIFRDAPIPIPVSVSGRYFIKILVLGFVFLLPIPRTDTTMSVA